MIGKVKSVDDAQRTCEVEPINGDADLIEVRLQAVQSGNTGWYMKPKVNSDVLVTFVNKDLAFVAMCSEVEELRLNIGTQTVTVKSTEIELSGLTAIKGSTNDLKSVLGGLFDLLNAAQLVVSGAVAQFNPVDKAQLLVYKAQLNDFLK